MREAILYEKLAGGAVRCHVCLWRCRINPGKYGVCKTRVNLDGALHTLIYGLVSSAAVDPIEKKPLFHFFPTSQVFSLGSFGCNLHCKHCQNWQISYAAHDGVRWLVEGKTVSSGNTISARDCIELAKRHSCRGIAWTYNEPAIWLEYTLDGARLARENTLYSAYVTNGSITPEGLDAIGPLLDAYRVDVKGFDDRVYSQVANLPKGRWQQILDVTARAKHKWNMHVEVVTNVIPGCNDDEEQLTGIARWIRDELGESTPWHVTRFYPHAEFQHVSPTPIGTLERAQGIGLRAGLRFVYVGNVPGTEGENTYCYECKRLAIERIGFHTRLVGVAQGGRCHNCGADLNVRGI